VLSIDSSVIWSDSRVSDRLQRLEMIDAFAGGQGLAQSPGPAFTLAADGDPNAAIADAASDGGAAMRQLALDPIVGLESDQARTVVLVTALSNSACMASSS